MVPTNAPEGPRSECIGYAAFCRRLETDAEFAHVVPVSSATTSHIVARLHGPRRTSGWSILQRELIDLIDFLDPKSVRIPAHRCGNRLAKTPAQRSPQLFDTRPGPAAPDTATLEQLL